MASAIPRSIEINVSTMDFGQRIYMSDLTIPAGVSATGLVSITALNNLLSNIFKAI